MQVTGPPDQRLAQLLGLQHGCVSRRQLLAAGLTQSQIQTRIERGQLEPVHRGVYTAAAIPDVPLRREAAALLACGPSAVLGLMTAASVWKILPPQPSSTPIDVALAAGSRGRVVAGIALRQAKTLTDAQIRAHRGLPVTSPERTLLDIATLDELSERRLERALDEALALRITSATKLAGLLAENYGRRGRARLARLLAHRQASTVTRSDAEEMFLGLIRQAGLPDPQMGAAIAGFTVDAYWPQARFAVEIDGYQWHTTWTNFNRDRRKDRALQRLGIQVSRVTWWHMKDEALQLIAEIATALALRTRAVVS